MIESFWGAEEEKKVNLEHALVRQVLELCRQDQSLPNRHQPCRGDIEYYCTHYKKPTVVGFLKYWKEKIDT